MKRWSPILWVLALACTDDVDVPIGQKIVGAACNSVSECAPGLDCVGGVCTPFDEENLVGSAGYACSLDTDCQTGLCCGNQSVCRTRLISFEADSCGTSVGRPCEFAADCDVGLVCSGFGLCSEANQPNTADVGEACEVLEDCRRPLLCGLDGTCEEFPYFEGVSCVASEEELGAFRMYFEVPRGAPLAEFYRLPYPNDIRAPDGQLDLSGHPTASSESGLDFDGLYLRTLEEDFDGFGLTAPIYMRFSDRLDPRTLGVGTTTAAIGLIDITPGSPTYQQPADIQWRYDVGSGLFICGSTLVIAPEDGRPLRPNTTYAVLIRRTIKSAKGKLPIRDPDFQAMVAAAPPEDPGLQKAYEAYAPLRTFLDDNGLPESQVAGAVVFTTGDPASIGPRLRAAVRAAPAPQLQDVVNCDAGGNSVCGFGDPTRGCALPTNAKFHHLQARVSNPVFQNGTRPYLQPGNDRQGALILDNSGTPELQGSEDLCVSISVPTGTAPAGGWPVVLFAHGTGGNYLGGVAAFAEDFADIQGDAGPLAKVAMISFDNIMHGPRQGLPPTAWQDPGPLFFNVQNPRAARDNILQGSADLFNLVRLLETAQISTAESGLAEVVNFNPDRIIFYGHSQGTVIAPAFLANETNLRAAVLTGAGGELALSLVEKTQPNNLAAATRVLLGDQGVDRLHPLIGVMSHLFGPADAIPFAADFTSTDLLHIYGLRDSFTPESAQAALVRAMGAPVVMPMLRDIDVPTIDDSVRGNLGGFSVASVQFEPTGTDDGHFVARNDPLGEAAVLRFIGTAASSDQAALIRRRATP